MHLHSHGIGVARFQTSISYWHKCWRPDDTPVSAFLIPHCTSCSFMDCYIPHTGEAFCRSCQSFGKCLRGRELNCYTPCAGTPFSDTKDSVFLQLGRFATLKLYHFASGPLNSFKAIPIYIGLQPWPFSFQPVGTGGARMGKTRSTRGPRAVAIALSRAGGDVSIFLVPLGEKSHCIPAKGCLVRLGRKGLFMEKLGLCFNFLTQ